MTHPEFLFKRTKSLKNSSGAVIFEYALLAGLIGMVSIVALTRTGDTSKVIYDDAKEQIAYASAVPVSIADPVSSLAHPGCYLAENQGTIGHEDWYGCVDMYIIGTAEFTAIAAGPTGNGSFAVADPEGGQDYTVGFNERNIFTGQVDNFDRAFSGLYYSGFDEDISHLDTINAIQMNYIFASNTNFNRDISNWNTSNVTNFSAAFKQSVFNQNINDWDVSKNIRLIRTFENSSFNQPLDRWDTSGVNDFSRVFNASVFNQNISDWNTQSATTMNFAFSNNSDFDQDLSRWNVDGVTSCNSFGQNSPQLTSKPSFTSCTE